MTVKLCNGVELDATLAEVRGIAALVMHYYKATRNGAVGFWTLVQDCKRGQDAKISRGPATTEALTKLKLAVRAIPMAIRGCSM